ncbi:SDR family NAD(P)-dependent oxidoreductase [Paenibacillus durus]|uniref:SDR family NAD(P)-dependent oxidoreductase n=1 Tax=Paenibacillus durus TaxID=44251 RepID=UPI000694E64F|nr:SDR family NAD(P)-dependent oxidoreductase [Paenibacillus durus]
MINNPARKQILESIQAGRITAEEGLERLKKLSLNEVHYFQSYWEENKLTHFMQTQPKNILIFGSGGSLSQNLEQGYRLAGSGVIQITPGEEFQTEHDGAYRVNPGQAEHYDLLLKAVRQRGIIPEHILWLWSEEDLPESGDTRVQAAEALLALGIKALTLFSQSVMKLYPAGDIRLLFIHNSSISAHHPFPAAISGFIRSLRQENPRFIYKSVAVAASNAKLDSQQIRHIAEQEWSASTDKAIEISYEGKSRYTQAVREIEPQRLQKQESPFIKGGSYLITGGLGGLGYLFAAHMARKVQAKLVLTGRSALDQEKARKLEDLQALGAEVMYIQADVAVHEDVKRIAEQIKQRFHSLHGIIHSAGNLRDGLLYGKSMDDMDAVIRPKVLGAIHLDQLFKDQQLDFFAMFSSTAALTGSIGQTDYAYANSFMDHFAAFRSSCRPGRSLSVNWPLWKEGGMTADQSMIDRLSAFGIDLLEEQEGIMAFERCLNSELTSMAVLKGDSQRMKLSFGVKRSSVPAPARQAQETSMQASAAAPEGSPQEARRQERTAALIKNTIAEVLRLSPERINLQEPFDSYGIDSVVIMEVTRRLEQLYGPLSKTLFFEYGTVMELTGYFLTNHPVPAVLIDEAKSEPEAVSVPAQPESLGQTAIPITGKSRRLVAAAAEAEDLKGPVQQNKTAGDIAIIGLGGRYPLAANLEEFWDNLRAGRDCITEIPQDRWNHRKYFNPEKGVRGKTYTKWGGFIRDYDKFDPLFFHISPREAEFMDPQERIFLEVAWETAEDAGYTRKKLKNRKTGVFVGVMYGQYQLYGTEHFAQGEGIALNSSYASIANRVSYTLDLNGPSIALDTMCSSSLTSIHLACESIRSGGCDMALAGGVNLSIHPHKYLLLSQGKFAASDGRCRSFGEGGDGYVPGEGAGAVLLKPLEQAIQDGDLIYGVIKGSSLNHGGKTNGYTVPSPAAQASLIIEAMHNAGVKPDGISYIEAHGTGTSLGDPIEISGLSRAFGGSIQEMGHCSIGSVKSNIGHLESAAGIAAVTKVLLQMKYRILVPSIHAQTLNPNIDFQSSPFRVQRTLEPWGQPESSLSGNALEPRRAGVSAFGAGGSNAHLILEEYTPRQNIQRNLSDAPQIIILSARTEPSLRAYAKRLHDHLQKWNAGAEVPSLQGAAHGSADLEQYRKGVVDIINEVWNINIDDINLDDPLADMLTDVVKITETSLAIRKKFGVSLPQNTLEAFASLEALAAYLWESSDRLSAAGNELTSSRYCGNEAFPAIADIAFTLQTGKEAMEERLAFVAASPQELQELLGKWLAGEGHMSGLFRGTLRFLSDNTLFEGEDGKTFVEQIIRKKNLAKLCQLWTSGVDIDWSLLHEPGSVQRISLPTYAFAKERYWLPDMFEQSANIQSQGVPHSSYHLLEKAWKEAAIDRAASASGKTEPIQGTVIILAGSESADIEAVSLLKHLPDVKTVIVRERKESDTGSFAIDYKRFEEGAAAAKTLMEREQAIMGVIDLADCQAGESGAGLMGRLGLLQQLIKDSYPAPGDRRITLRLFHVTQGLQPFANDAPSLAGAQMAGWIRMLGAEYGHVEAKTLDLDRGSLSLTALNEIVALEWASQDSHSELCYRSQRRYAPYLQEQQLLTAQAHKRQSHWTGDASKAVVITGGTRGLGSQMAAYLVKQGVRKLVLMGANPLPPRQQWDSATVGPAETAEKIRRIRELERSGAEVELYTGPLTDEASLRLFFNGIRNRWGAIGGVIHCAGRSHQRNPAFIHKTEEDINDVLAPKIEGLQVLERIFAEDRLNYFILFSSISGTVPRLGAGVSDYAAANAYMDYFAQYQRAQGKRSYHSISWTHWRGAGMEGMESPAYQQLGLRTHTVGEGFELLEYVMENGAAYSLPCVADAAGFQPGSWLRAKQVLQPKESNTPTHKLQGNSQQSPGKANIKGTSNAGNRNMLTALKELFSEQLKIPLDRLDEHVSFGDYGVDSILLAELVKRIEEMIGTNLEPTVVLEHPTLSKLAGHLQTFATPVTFHSLDEPDQPNESYSVYSGEKTEPVTVNSKIAVIGAACHFPGAPDKDAYWKLLSEGRSGIRQVPASRWDVDKYYSTEASPGRSISKWGGFIDGIEQFDPEYFNISKEDAPFIDPLMRQFMEVSAQTIRDAGYESKELWNKKIGVFVGSRSGTFASKLKQIRKHDIVGIGQNFIAAHISHLFNFKGPNLVVDTACSSSLVSLHLASQSLLLGECEAALAGGVDLLLDEKSYLILSEGGALSPDGQCHTFDEKANGFVPGEGCGAVLLKRLDKAIADGDQIYAVIEASAVNNDGRTMGITTPNAEAQEAVIREALEKCGVDPSTISYIEAHGTGTLIGDPIELRALSNVFGSYTEQQQYCAVGSVKSNIGHLLSAAGIASFIKVILSLKNGQLPPTLNCQTPNPRFKFQESPFYPNTSLKLWEPHQGIRRAGISSFGFGGTNAHIIVSESGAYPESAKYAVRQPLAPAVFNKQYYWMDELALGEVSTPLAEAGAAAELPDTSEWVLEIVDETL